MSAAIIEDLETQITGEVQTVFEPREDFSPSTPTARNGNESRKPDNYEQIKKQEVKHNWLNHEGTNMFLAQLQKLRSDRLNEAENLAKIGKNDQALRILLQSCSIRETIDIVTTEIN